MMDPTLPVASQGHPVILVNSTYRQRLKEIGLQHLHDAPLDLAAARQVAHQLEVNGTRLFLLAQLNAALQWLCLRYLSQHAIEADWEALHFASNRHSYPTLGQTFCLFQDAYALRNLPEEALQHQGQGETIVAARRRLVAAICLLDIQLDNPALDDLTPLFEEQTPTHRQRYKDLLDHLTALWPDQQAVPALNQPLRTLLEAPRRAAPDNLEGQLDYALVSWGDLLPEELVHNLTIARAIAREESRQRAPGPGPTPLPEFGKTEDSWEPAAFTPDTDWMPNAVLLAKSIHVWLGQLSRQYDTSITTLDQIPDAELDRLAHWGINALWLIGIWQRSRASRTIKQMRGNPEAEASAYALDNYRVAFDLGGEEALDNLEARCTARGIRLACDVVPNHTGIDSEWVRYHPDWFIQSEHPPYPAYRFSGTDLSDDPAISIRIEDGYWDNSDAAVTFEHHDHHSGRRRYIYHGNDGTHMPWNDTAQLNFLLPEVRQTMSDLIVDVARRFRLIRFDAAMTLARKHFRRLWFPPPGGSAGVPSRSSWCLSNKAFDQAFPVEFWREVVDRINQEVPDTLLIAEAFWLMESYFVRNLGMHRVYNSAFMNLLKREENAKYRRILKDVLAYNPEILKRYVNFMNNPDEATAVEQFGKDDKYFGTAVLLTTLPGLPMFGHGQIEGYREKYGMEFRQAYWDEKPDAGFIAHHEDQICPLLRQRRLFSEVRHFALYDLLTDQGVNENLYIYSNGTDEERCLVVYNNSPEPATGRISASSPKALPDQEGETRPGRSLAEELGLKTTDAPFCRFRNHRDNLEHLQPIRSLHDGLEISLDGYQYHLFHDFQPLPDPDGAWERLYRHLNGRAVPSLDAAALRFRQPALWQATQRLFAPERLLGLAGPLTDFPLQADVRLQFDTLVTDFESWLGAFTSAAQLPTTGGGPALRDRLTAMFNRVRLGLDLETGTSCLAPLWSGEEALAELTCPLFSWQLCEEFMLQFYRQRDPQRLLQDFGRFGLDQAWQEILPAAESSADFVLVAILLMTAEALPHPAENLSALRQLTKLPLVRRWLQINQYKEETWFDRDRMQRLCAALVLQRLCAPTGSPVRLATDLERFRRRIERAEAGGYRLDKFLTLG